MERDGRPRGVLRHHLAVLPVSVFMHRQAFNPRARVHLFKVIVTTWTLYVAAPNAIVAAAVINAVVDAPTYGGWR